MKTKVHMILLQLFNSDPMFWTTSVNSLASVFRAVDRLRDRTKIFQGGWYLGIAESVGHALPPPPPPSHKQKRVSILPAMPQSRSCNYLPVQSVWLYTRCNIHSLFISFISFILWPF